MVNGSTLWSADIPCTGTGAKADEIIKDGDDPMMIDALMLGSGLKFINK